MLDLLVGPIAKLLDKVIPDADERGRLAHEIATLAERQAHEIAKAQIEVNQGRGKQAIRCFVSWMASGYWDGFVLLVLRLTTCLFLFAILYLLSLNPLSPFHAFGPERDDACSAWECSGLAVCVPTRRQRTWREDEGHRSLACACWMCGSRREGLRRV